MEVWSCFSQVQDERRIGSYLENGISKSVVLVIGMPIFGFIEYTLMELFRKPGNWRQICKQTSSTFYTSNDNISDCNWTRTQNHLVLKISL